MKRGMWILGAVLATGLVVSILVLRQRNPSLGEVGAGLSPRQASTLNDALAPRISEALGGLDLGADVQGMATTAGARIAGTTEARRSRYRFQFHVLADTALAEAYALPGGTVFLTRGLIDRLENEAQLAGMLAHQVSHVLSRHVAKRFTASDRGDSAVTKMLELRYSAEEEIEADTLSVRLLGEAGYDPRALVDLVRISEEATRLGGGRGFSTRHPRPEERTNVLHEAIARAYPQGIPTGLTLGRWFAPEPPPEPEEPAWGHDPADSESVSD